MCTNYFMETILSVLTICYLSYSSILVNTLVNIHSILYKSKERMRQFSISPRNINDSFFFQKRYTKYMALPGKSQKAETLKSISRSVMRQHKNRKTIPLLSEMRFFPFLPHLCVCKLCKFLLPCRIKVIHYIVKCVVY